MRGRGSAARRLSIAAITLPVLGVFGTLSAGLASESAPAGPTAPDADVAVAALEPILPRSQLRSLDNPQLTTDEWNVLSLADALQAVPYEARIPDSLPTGWEVVGAAILPLDVSGDGEPDVHRLEMGLLPAGAAADAHVGLKIIQSEQLGPVPDEFRALPSVELSDGSTAYLTRPTGELPQGAVTWWSESIYFTVSAAGLDVEALIEIAESM